MIYQAQDKGCGYASVKMMLELSGYKGACFIEEPHIEGQSPSLGELIEYASGAGLSLSGYKFLEPSGLATFASFPIIALLKSGEKEHLVVIKRRRGDRYFVMDPSSGAMWIKEKDLLKDFSGVYLKRLSFDPAIKAKKSAGPIKKPFFSYFLPFFPLLEAALAFIGVTFFSSLDNFLLLIVFVSVYALLILSRSIFLMGAFESFDKRYAPYLARVPFGERKASLSHYLSYKKEAIMPLALLPENLACFAFFYFLMAINELSFALLCLIPLSFIAFDRLALANKRKSLRKELERREDAYLLGGSEQKESEGRLSSLFSFSSFLTRFLCCKKAVLVLLCLSISCLSLLNGSFSSNRFLLLLFASVYLTSLLERVFEGVEGIDKENKERGYFLHLIRESRQCKEERENGKI